MEGAEVDEWRRKIKHEKMEVVGMKKKMGAGGAWP